jgi:tetratricopeptide (TPR) repeat protein
MNALHRIALPLLALTLLAPAVAFAGPSSPSGRNFTGENPLGVSRAEFGGTQEGMELIYQRRYPEALQVFEELGIDFPDSPVGPVGRALVWQAVMFENYDFSQERAYMTEYAEAKDRLKRASRSHESRAWIYFLEAVHLGVDAMWDIRHERYLPAFDKAWDAMELVKKVERLEPEFVDVQLAFGLYNYWRTAITEQVDALPNFGDRRAEGLAQMKLAKKEGLLARGPASLVLTYSYLEAKDYEAAIAEAMWAREHYPGSILNEMTLGRVYRRARKYDEALATFEHVLELAPDNKRVWFHIGEIHYKSRRNNPAATQAYKRYLETKPLPIYEAHTLYRLGMVERRARRYAEAISYLERAVEIWPKFKTAAERLEQTRKDLEKQATRPAPKPRSTTRTVAEPRPSKTTTP